MHTQPGDHPTVLGTGTLTGSWLAEMAGSLTSQGGAGSPSRSWRAPVLPRPQCLSLSQGQGQLVSPALSPPLNLPRFQTRGSLHCSHPALGRSQNSKCSEQAACLWRSEKLQGPLGTLGGVVVHSVPEFLGYGVHRDTGGIREQLFWCSYE